MAKAQFVMPEQFLSKISKLGEATDKIVPKVLAAGAELVEKNVRSNLSSVIGKNTKADSRSSGQLLSALGTTAARQDKDGNFNVKIGFAENRTDGKSNAMIAGVLEYGKHGQPPKPFMKTAKTKSKDACIRVMEKKLEEEIKKL
ncbi:MAG TPA: HK97 gp10 family phage protein [Ruminococcus flavefaciens]|jgi:HK97 gp10 family phage protein|nr:HK97 gp10 family phage protein [Ruminococcus flavefaciens]